MVQVTEGSFSGGHLISTESPCSHWPLGKAVEVYPGKDGHVRSVKLTGC